jgi:hypothetical protein
VRHGGRRALSELSDSRSKSSFFTSPLRSVRLAHGLSLRSSAFCSAFLRCASGTCDRYIPGDLLYVYRAMSTMIYAPLLDPPPSTKTCFFPPFLPPFFGPAVAPATGPGSPSTGASLGCRSICSNASQAALTSHSFSRLSRCALGAEKVVCPKALAKVARGC